MRVAEPARAVFCLGSLVWSVACTEAECPSGTVERSGHCIVEMAETSSTANPENMTSAPGTVAEGDEGQQSGTSGAGAAQQTQQSNPASSAPMSSGSGSAGQSSAAGASSLPAGAAGQSGAGSSASPPSAAGASGAASNGDRTACQPAEEACDNVDNDCDGKVDEALTKDCGSSMGICKPGKLGCHNGQWDDVSLCEGGIRPSKEECDPDQKDENCDGVANEGCSCTEGEKRPCGSATPPCKQGTVTCTAGQWPGASECSGDIKPGTETCDGVDNDCNGTKDDGGDKLCPGQRCGGASGCVECLSDADCRGQSAPTCKVAYCDTARHACATKNAANGTDCGGGRSCNDGACVACSSASDCADKVCQNKSCTGGECVYSSVQPGNPHASCRSGWVCTSGRTCAECADSKQCASRGPGFECVNGTCRATCPNGQIDPGEDCEVSLLNGADARYCNPSTCKWTSVFGSCSGGLGPGCTPPCAIASDCPTPRGSEVVTCSSNSNGSWCEYSCGSGNATCPPGGTCAVFICQPG
jgi:hypothetical protein